MTGSDTPQQRRHEAEHQGPIWKHPYMIYIMLTAALFGFLVLMAYLALKNNWIPSRGI
jgi:hypothetical protein